MRKGTDRWGKRKSKFESQRHARNERSIESSAFEDLGIRKRMPIKPPKYTSSKEFLREIDSDESDVERKPFDIYGVTG